MLSQLFRAPRPAPLRTARIASCEWQTDDTFLIARLYPDRCSIPVDPAEHAREVLKQLPSGLQYFFFHLNGTFTADFLKSRELLLAGLHERGVTTLNADITDISKSLLQKTCLQTDGLNSTLATREGDPAELLIAKTNLNYAGKIEALLTSRQQRRIGLSPQSPLMDSVLSRVQEYPVLPRREIPADWWQEPQIVIERFISNSDERFYRIHVLRDRISITDAIVPGVVKKLAGGIKAKHHYFTFAQLDAAHPSPATAPEAAPAISPVLLNLTRQTRLLQQHLHFDFAAIDAVVDDSGNTYLIDVNVTPWAGHTRLDHPMFVFLRTALP
jgi:hypothetical protein